MDVGPASQTVASRLVSLIVRGSSCPLALFAFVWGVNAHGSSRDKPDTASAGHDPMQESEESDVSLPRLVSSSSGSEEEENA